MTEVRTEDVSYINLARLYYSCNLYFRSVVCHLKESKNIITKGSIHSTCPGIMACVEKVTTEKNES